MLVRNGRNGRDRLPPTVVASSNSVRPGRGGRSGGFRTIMLFRSGALAFFVYGFAKNDRQNPRPDELVTFRLLADEYLALTEWVSGQRNRSARSSR